MVEKTEVFVHLSAPVDNLNMGEIGRYSEEVAANLVERGLGVITGRVVNGVKIKQEHPAGAHVESGDMSDDDEKKQIEAALVEKDKQVARQMYDSLKSKNPDLEEPNLAKWAKDIAKLRKSGPDHAYIKQVFVFARGNNEWSKKIKTPANLHKHFAEIRVDLDKARAEIDNPDP